MHYALRALLSEIIYLRINTTSGLRLASCYHLLIYQLCDKIKPSADDIRVKSDELNIQANTEHVSPTTCCVKGQYSESSASVFIVSCRDVLSPEAAAGNRRPAASCSPPLTAAVCSHAQFGDSRRFVLKRDNVARSCGAADYRSQAESLNFRGLIGKQL